MNRRTLLKSMLGTALGVTQFGCSQMREKPSNPKQLNIYSWADYLHPDTIPEFEKRFGIKVVYDTFASNESLLAKLQAGASDYDVIVPTSYMVKQLKKLGRLSIIEHDRLPLLSNIMTRFQNPSFDKHLEHSIPYTWGTTGIGFNSEIITPQKAEGLGTDIFWNDAYAHRMTLLDDARETIGMAIKKQGHSFNTVSEQEIRAGCDALIKQKPLVMCYTSDQVIVQLVSGDSHVSLVYSGDAYQARRDNSHVQYVIPEHGTSLWLDNLCIPVGAPHPENAYKWLNFMLEPEIAAATASYTKYATPNSKAYKLLPSEVTADTNLYPAEAVLDRCEELGDIGTTIFFYDKLWTELKCA